MKNHYEGGELDRKETISRLVADVENWDIERLRCYAKECVEADLQRLTSDDLIDHWASELGSDEIPRFTYSTSEYSPVAELGNTRRKRRVS